MKLTENRLSYLLYLNDTEKENHTITKMASHFQVSKSTVSRNLEAFVNHGIVFSETMVLTGYGERLAEKYNEEVDLIQLWLRLKTGLDIKTCRSNAIKMVVYLSEELKDQLIQKIRMNRIFRKLDFPGDILFSEFSGELEDGTYPVSFVISRKDITRDKWLSMADDGFEHPGKLRVNCGIGSLQLKAISMEQRSFLENLIMSGKLLKLEYAYRGEFIQAVKTGDCYDIPADALKYIFKKEEGLLIGKVILRLSAPISKSQLHKREAVLSVIIHEI